MEDQAVSERRTELRRAVIELRARGLNAPAKWAAEQLTGLSNSDDNHTEQSTSSTSDEEDSDIFLLAKSYFDLKVMLQHSTVAAQHCCSTTRVSTGTFTRQCVLAGVSQSCACLEDKSRKQGQVLAMLCLIPGRREAKRVCLQCCCHGCCV